jgi:uncharacterized membrane protein YfcA
MSLLIGLAAGIFGGLVGLGGGAVMIPLMVSFLKVGQHKAHGTSLVVLVFTGALGALVYGMNHNVDVMAAVLLAIPAMMTARVGARYCTALPEWKLRRAFGIFLMVVSALMVLKFYLPFQVVPLSGWAKIVLLILTGLLTGFLAGLMGVGGGALMIIAMVLIGGFNQHVAQGSALLAIIPGGMVGAYTHWRLGNTEGNLLKGLILGILAGTWVGGSFANVLPEGILRIIFVVVLVWIGMQYLRTQPAANVCIEEL